MKKPDEAGPLLKKKAALEAKIEKPDKKIARLQGKGRRCRNPGRKPGRKPGRPS